MSELQFTEYPKNNYKFMYQRFDKGDVTGYTLKFPYSEGEGDIYISMGKIELQLLLSEIEGRLRADG